MKRAREVLSATAEVATSEAPPNDPALPKHPPQPVPPGATLNRVYAYPPSASRPPTLVDVLACVLAVH